jgi:hypothetical protein
MLRVEHVKGDVPCPPVEFHRFRPGALQATIFQPAVPFGRRDRQNVLDFTGDYGQVFDT